MKILVERRKGDLFVEMEEEYDTEDYLEAIRQALERHSDAGYSVCRVKNLEPVNRFNELVGESNADPRN